MVWNNRMLQNTLIYDYEEIFNYKRYITSHIIGL